MGAKVGLKGRLTHLAEELCWLLNRKHEESRVLGRLFNSKKERRNKRNV